MAQEGDLNRFVYSDGQQVLIGDVLSLGASTGRVVGLPEAGVFEPRLVRTEWSYLTGVLCEYDQFGLIHYPNGVEADVVLISRATSD